ncbi:MAG: transposase [Candidatus Binatia bacterium]
MALTAADPPRQPAVVPRVARIAPGGSVFHVLNRANGHGRLFETPGEYREFLAILGECAALDTMRILAFCAMPNHWHLLLWPRGEGDLARFVHRVALRHTQRWHARNDSKGRGHLYQGRYKSFPVATDHHLLTVCRYIERNPLRANLVERAEFWPWSSAAEHSRASGSERVNIPTSGSVPLAPLPVRLPSHWAELLHRPQNQGELDAMRSCVRQGLPCGSTIWRRAAARELGIRLEPGRNGRPPKNGSAAA